MKRGATLLVISLTAGALWGASGEPKIADLVAEEQGGEIFVSFRLQNAFTPEIRELIESGAPVTFKHRVCIVRNRKWWLDKTAEERVVATTLRYDLLTRQYRLTRERDGLKTDDWTTESVQDAALWMSRLDAVSAGAKPDSKGQVYIRVRTELLKDRLLFFIPWALKTPWAQISLGTK